ncbi:MAG: helicase-exonuclease AddAB subunit AddA [Clostridia bacterium]|nr:helicase-exonuclease AddAB subunit AddA [Clostridia bacterium]
MAAFEPTQAQKNAIEAEGGSIIVSAAAGSGKTRVLVQRVIRLLTEKMIPADRLLILTFTNTAAAEMKARISKAIDALIDEEPNNHFYRRQQLLLSSADICTIDSFCSKVVRENFFRFGISRDFRIGSGPELHELKRKIMSDVIEEYYQPPKEEDEAGTERFDSFGHLSLLLTGSKLDSDLEDQLLMVYDKYRAHAFPDLWFERCLSQYDPKLDINKNPSARYLMNEIKPYVRQLRMLYEEAYEYRGVIEQLNSQKSKKMYVSALDAFDSYEYFLSDVEELFAEDDLNIASLAGMISDFEKVKISTGASKEPEIIFVAKHLNGFADIVIKKMQGYAVFTEKIIKENNEKLYPVMACLAGLIKDFDQRFFAAKTDKSLLDFNDLERLVLELLYDKNSESGEYEKSGFAAEMAEKYYEIMVDEYQDTNDVQESIFKAISQNENNLFVVGDVKQSIYRFREAEPRLFQKRCAESTLYDENNPKFPALIVLDRNFRSRSGIIDSVNYVFDLLMSEKAGEIEYDETHRLTAGAVYPEISGDVETELHIVEYAKASVSGQENEDDEEDSGKVQTEAKYCAELIDRMIRDGVQVTENGTLRKAGYQDFCILLRSVKNTAHYYSEELENLGIPACTDTDFDLLECYEVRAALSFLKILNNPLSDIDMIASLMCPVFGFTPDELARLKGEKGRSYYKKILGFAGDEDDLFAKKCRDFVKIIRRFRNLSVTMPADKLLGAFYEETGFISVMNAMPGGGLRVQNLRRLLQFAAEYEAGTSGGLTGFVRHVKYLEETQSGIKVSDVVPANAVRIMTIHHSKGLEFPICILAGTNSPPKNDTSKIRFHSDLGIGIRAMDTDKLIRYNTIQFSAIDAANKNEEKSEMMRVLYVAMTRAKEKLIMISTINAGQTNEEKEGISEKYARKLAGLAKQSQLTAEQKFDPTSVVNCTTYSDWLLMCALVNDTAVTLRQQLADSGYFDGESATVRNAPKWNYYCIGNGKSSPQYKEEKIKADIDPGFAEFLRKRFAEEEQSDISTLIPSKVSASMLAHKETSHIYVAASKPNFARGEKASPTERGTATHAFLQYADFHALKTEIDETGGFEAEKKRIVENQIMSPEQAELIIPENILAFTRTDLFRRMLNAEKLYKEYRFTVNIPGELAVPGNSELSQEPAKPHEKTESILQGAIDCIIEEKDGLVIVDYKTDRVKDPAELAGIYGLQLKLYKEAANMLFDKPVRECCIYSLHCGQAVICH